MPAIYATCTIQAERNTHDPLIGRLQRDQGPPAVLKLDDIFF